MKKLLTIFLTLFQFSLASGQVTSSLLQKAEAGDANAMYELALQEFALQSTGEQDYSKCLEWLKKAAEKGHADAVNDIGTMYLNGIGVPIDYEKAADFFSYASSLGSFAGKNNLDHMNEWARTELFYNDKAIPPMIYLGSRYYYGIDGKIDYKKAYELYSKADSLGDHRATAKLGQMYYYGYYVEQDYKKAFDLLSKASNKNPPQTEAMQLLSTCYRFGYGTEKDINKADFWLKKAAEAGDLDANSVMSLLGDETALTRMRKIEATEKQEKAHKDSLIASAVVPTVDLSQIGNDTIQVGPIQIVMIGVQGGTFNMGADIDYSTANQDRPIHAVTLSSYYIAQTEVTQELWKLVMKKNPSHFKGDQRPVERVSWYDCQEFINKLNKITGKKFRLPTEAEWEFAARGGNKKCHNDQSGGAVFNIKQTMDVASMYPNCLGIYDMSGNVDEWCLDDDAHYTFDSQVNPLMVTSKKWPGCRGGSYYSQYHYLTQKYGMDPNWENDKTGFRLAMSRDGNQ